MGFHAFNHTVNVVSYIKNNQKYAATIAWAMQVDYDKIIFLMGAQSVTGNKIVKGDMIGVSALNKNQKELAIKLGDTHSDQVDKLKDIPYSIDDSAILINNATRQMKVIVNDILHLDGIKEDNLIFATIISSSSNGEEFLSMDDFD